jgi:hypothetical protein
MFVYDFIQLDVPFEDASMLAEAQWLPDQADHPSGERRSGVDRRSGRDRRSSIDLWREMGRPGPVDLRSGVDRRSAEDRRRGMPRHRSAAEIVTAWQLPEPLPWAVEPAIPSVDFQFTVPVLVPAD